MVNYNEQPVAQTFIDTYAPLPFQELAMLGTAYKRERDETEAAIDQFKAQYGDFQTMSSADAASWDRLTMGALNPSLIQMASDPDKIKSQEFQAGIRSAIRGVDTGKLGQLRQSADNYRLRAANIAKLKSLGKYKESWDHIDMTSWDTLGGKGVMEDTSPLEYRSLEEIGSPYTSGLKDSYLGKIDRYRYSVGVDEKKIRESLNVGATDIFNTPQGQAWYRDVSSELAMRGINDPEEVRNEVMERLVQSQMDHTHNNIQYDTAALKEDEMALRRTVAAQKRAGSGKSEEETGPPARLTDMIRLDGTRFIKDTLTKAPISPQDSSDLERAVMDLRIATVKGNQSDITKAQSSYGDAMAKSQKANLNTFARNNFEQASGKSLDDPASLTDSDIYRGSKSVIDELSTDIPANGARDILSEIANATPKENGVIEYRLSDSKMLQDPTRVVSQMEGIKLKKRKTDFDRLLDSGALKNVKIEPLTGKGVFNYIDANGKLKQKLKVTVRVKESDIDLSKVNKHRGNIMDEISLIKLLQDNGGTIDDASEDEVRTTNTYDVHKGNQKLNKVSQNISNKNKDIYVTFESMIDIPDEVSGVQGTSVSSINANHNRRQLTGTQAGGIYSAEQDNAFYPDLDDLLDE